MPDPLIQITGCADCQGGDKCQCLDGPCGECEAIELPATLTAEHLRDDEFPPGVLVPSDIVEALAVSCPSVIYGKRVVISFERDT